MASRGNPGQGGHRDHGFSLIELLVVIIIIGILAAIAIPIFMAQRAQAFDSAIKSDLRTLAQFQEAYLVDHDDYATVAQLLGAGYDPVASSKVTLTLRIDGATGFCISGVHPGTSTTWYYDSRAAGLQPKGTAACPVTVGVAAGSVLGRS